MKFNEGDRVRLVLMGDDPDPIPAGSEGTVTDTFDFGDGAWQIGIKWDNGRSLYCVCPPDVLTMIKRAGQA